MVNLGLFSRPIKTAIAYSCLFPGDRLTAILSFGVLPHFIGVCTLIEYDGIGPSLPAYQTGFLPLKEYSEPVTRIELVSTAWKAVMLILYTTRTGGSPTVHDTATLQSFEAANSFLNLLAMHFHCLTKRVFSKWSTSHDLATSDLASRCSANWTTTTGGIPCACSGIPMILDSSRTSVLSPVPDLNRAFPAWEADYLSI